MPSSRASICVHRFINDNTIEPGLRFHTDVRKMYTDVQHTLSIEPTEVEDSGRILAVATNKAGEAKTESVLTIEGQYASKLHTSFTQIKVLFHRTIVAL